MKRCPICTKFNNPDTTRCLTDWYRYPFKAERYMWEVYNARSIKSVSPYAINVLHPLLSLSLNQISRFKETIIQGLSLRHVILTGLIMAVAAFFGYQTLSHAHSSTVNEQKKKQAHIEKTKPIELPSPKTVTNSLGMTFVWIEPGTFMMGRPSSESSRNDYNIQHQVTLTQGFFMQTTEVTQGQWKRVMGSNPSYFSGKDLPVENVSWNEVQKFIKNLNQKGSNITYRLPTEAEWEYAARARRESFIYAGSNRIDEVAWCYIEANYKTHLVGTKQPNNLGLYDMSGNVWEWCKDWYGDYPTGSVNDPKGPSSGTHRVIRGGSWDFPAKACRLDDRGRVKPDDRTNNLGLRLAGH